MFWCVTDLGHAQRGDIMRIAKPLLVAAVALFIGGAASAATVTLTYSGTVTAIDKPGQSISVWSIGDRVSTTVAYDTNAIPRQSSASLSGFDFLFASMRNISQDLDYSVSPVGMVIRNSLRDTFLFGGTTDDGEAGYTLTGVDNTGNLYNSTMLSVLTPVNLQPGALSSLSLNVLTGSNSSICGNCEFFADLDQLSISTVQAVPVPAALPLMVLGLAGLGFAGRRRG